MKKLLFIALFSVVTLVGCTHDDSTTVRSGTEQKSYSQPNFSLELDDEDVVLLDDGKPNEASKIDCQDNIHQAAGQYIITAANGKRYLGMWQDVPFKLCPGHCWTGKSPKGLTRYFQTTPLPEGMDCSDYMDRVYDEDFIDPLIVEDTTYGTDDFQKVKIKLRDKWPVNKKGDWDGFGWDDIGNLWHVEKRGDKIIGYLIK